MTGVNLFALVRRCFLWIACLVLVSVPGWSVRAQTGTQMRSFRLSNGYPVSVSLTPKGGLWVRHGEVPAATLFDGYTRTTIDLPEAGNSRLVESRSGQIWSSSAEGLLLYERGEWSRHTIVAMRDELRNNPMRQLRPVSLVAAEVNRVFVLLPGQLFEYASDTAVSTVVLMQEQFALGKFIEMFEASDGGIWVIAEMGFLKLSGPLRRISATSERKVFQLPAGHQLLKLIRAAEDGAGNLVAVANFDSAGASRAIVELRSESVWFSEFHEDRTRQVWRGWDGALWAMSYNSLVRMQNSNFVPIDRYTSGGPNYDALALTNGTFWIGSGEGVQRYGPSLWRSPAGLLKADVPVYALENSSSNSLHCFATSEGLVEWRETGSKLVPWPEDFDPIFQARDGVYRLTNGLVLIGTATRSLLYSSREGKFSRLEHPAKRAIRVIGQLHDGSLLFKTHPLDGRAQFRIEVFDGTTFRHYLEPDADASWGADVWYAVPTTSGDVYLGTVNGLAVRRAGEVTVEFMPVSSGIASERPVCVAEVGEGRIWAGTSDKIFELRNRRWEVIQTEIDRPNSILSTRDGTVWVASNSGIWHYFGGTWLHHEVEEGLPSGVVHDLATDRNGNLLVATGRGLVSYFPASDTDAPRTLEPIFDPSSEEGTLVRFRGVDKWDQTRAERLLYSYKLDEGQWTLFSTVTSKVFRDVGAGRHALEIRSMDRQGNRDPSSVQSSFMVVVPWFKDPRLVAVSVLGLVIILFLAGLAVNRHLQLVRSYAEVEQIVADRTRELEKANQEILHSQKMKALGTLASGIAHDFNNILSIIRGSAQIIASNVNDTEKVRVRVDRIQKVVEQGAGIVRSMLGLGRSDGQAAVLCDPAELLRETVRLMADRMPKEIECKVVTLGAVPRIQCAREVIQQILINLMLNAMDALPGRGVIRLEVSMCRDFPPQNLVLSPSPASAYLQLSVRDQGAGMPVDVITRIFEPFFTTKSLSARRGTGLGLSMVFELAKEFGYGLSVHSEQGEGSVFSLFIGIKNAS